MYNHKLAVALKSAGKVLREFGETVYVPYNSEYSILVKNLNSVRALVKVEIDGIDVGDGTRFIIDPNRDVELERFIKNGNLTQGNRLKFIERTSSIEKHRGVGVEDGLIRIEFNFEQVLNIQPTYQPHDWNVNNWDYPTWKRAAPKGGDITFGGDIANYSCSIGTSDVSKTVTDAGITVPGSVSDQQFKDGDWFPTEDETHVIVLQMLGQTEDNRQVIKPVTVRAKSKCSTCGRTNKATAKFCTECGTSLTIV